MLLCWPITLLSNTDTYCRFVYYAPQRALLDRHMQLRLPRHLEHHHDRIPVPRIQSRAPGRRDVGERVCRHYLRHPGHRVVLRHILAEPHHGRFSND